MRRTLVALVVLLAAVAGGVLAARSAPDPREPTSAALDVLPADVVTANITRWDLVRERLDVAAGAPADEAAPRLERAGFDTDLASVSVLGERTAFLDLRYGWSALDAEWEAFGQSRQGAVVVVSLPGVSAGTVADRLDALGYTAPDQARTDGGVWVGGAALVAGLGPRSSPLLAHVAVLADQDLVVLSDAAAYAERTVDVVRGERESLAADPAPAAVALDVAQQPVAVVHAGERGCAVTSLSGASRADRLAAARAIGAGPALARYDALALGLDVSGDGSTLTVAMGFSDPEQAAQQQQARLALTDGDAIGQGGTWDDRFDTARARLSGSDLLLELDSPDRDARLLSDLGTGGLLFAACSAAAPA